MQFDSPFVTTVKKISAHCDKVDGHDNEYTKDAMRDLKSERQTKRNRELVNRKRPKSMTHVKSEIESTLSGKEKDKASKALNKVVNYSDRIHRAFHMQASGSRSVKEMEKETSMELAGSLNQFVRKGDTSLQIESSFATKAGKRGHPGELVGQSLATVC